MNEITLSKLATLIIFLLVYCLPVSVGGMGNIKEPSASLKENANTNQESESNETNSGTRTKSQSSKNQEKSNNGEHNMVAVKKFINIAKSYFYHKITSQGWTNHQNDLSHWSQYSTEIIVFNFCDSIVIKIRQDKRGLRHYIVLNYNQNQSNLYITALSSDIFLPTSADPCDTERRSSMTELLRNITSGPSPENSTGIVAQASYHVDLMSIISSDNSSNTYSNNPEGPSEPIRIVYYYHEDQIYENAVVTTNRVNTHTTSNIQAIFNYLGNSNSMLDILEFDRAINSVQLRTSSQNQLRLILNEENFATGEWTRRPQPQSYTLCVIDRASWVVERVWHEILGLADNAVGISLVSVAGFVTAIWMQNAIYAENNYQPTQYFN